MIIKITAKEKYGMAHMVSIDTEAKNLPEIDWTKNRSEFTKDDKRKMNYNNSLRIVKGIAEAMEYDGANFSTLEIDGNPTTFDEVLNILEI